MTTTSFDLIRSVAASNTREPLQASDFVAAGVPAKSVRAMLHHLVVRGELCCVARGYYVAA